MYIIGGIIIFLVVLVLTGRKSVHNENHHKCFPRTSMGGSNQY